ncbi:T9SS type A sorting domain-containing protein [Psychroflexus aestuariivivens]|uniref:T9SS type A sorting domain-containing protein n=1 Tax=Psychroflexus aestuariivivens TaxID=1795040 RepID=UPI000FDC3872|nr:T9SS type A sorting domain-containing protein [Psychroflexus aestuariivivens]
MVNKYVLFFLLIGFTVSSQVTNEGKPISWKLNTEDVKTIKLPSFDLEKLQREDKINDQNKSIPWRFGFEHQVSLGFEDGKWFELDNGDKVWIMNIQSKDAKTMNFIFDEYHIPEGARLYFYSDDRRDLLGAYTQTQNRDDMIFGSWLIDGDNIWIEYYEPRDADFKGQLHISKAIHGYRSMSDNPDLEKGLNDSGACNQDVDCPVGSDFEDTKNQLKKSVGMVVVGGSGACTGTLINNTNNDETPYFLTANHCLGGNIGAWAFRFNWRSPNPQCATFSNSQNGVFDQTVSGATLRANNAKSDMALVEITAPLQPNWDLVWAGWDRSGNQPNFSVGIHHPSGDIMKVCRDDDSATQQSTQFGSEPQMQIWLINEWELGVTEPGSSGSALFNQDGKIIGQLAGGTAACSGTSDNGGLDFYGRFDVSWDYGNSSSSRLRDWLDPNNTGVSEIDQFPTTEVFNNDVALNILGINDIECLDNSIQPTFQVINTGVNIITSATLTYQLGNGQQFTENWSGNLENGESEEIASPVLSLSTGTNLIADIEINGITDENLNNNTANIELPVSDLFDTEQVSLTLVTDNYANETTWEFVDSNGNVIAQNGALSDATSYTDFFDVNEDECYTFRIFDAQNDGICCFFGEGSFILETSEGELIYSGGEFSDEDSVEFRIGESLSSEDFETESVSIYPNPTSEFIEISTSIETEFDVQVFDMNGKILMNLDNLNSNKIDLSELASGIYFVKLQSENQRNSITKKIIKK